VYLYVYFKNLNNLTLLAFNLTAQKIIPYRKQNCWLQTSSKQLTEVTGTAPDKQNNLYG
jgi:hypothetical protein